MKGLYTFEYHDEDHVDNFGVEHSVNVARDRLKGRQGDQIARPVPSYIIQGLEIGRDSGYTDGDNGGVDGHQQGAQGKRKQHNGQSPCCRILARGIRLGIIALRFDRHSAAIITGHSKQFRCSSRY